MKNQVDLLNGKILPSLTKLALPIMATSLLQMAYNMVDMIWIGRIGSGAVAAVGAAGMYIWLSSGIVALAKVGGQIKVGHSLGSGQQKEAAGYAKTALQLGVVLGLVFGIICVLGAVPLISFFRLNSREVIVEAEHYLRITGGGVIFSFITMILTGIMMALGNSTTPFKVTFVGLVINIILDPLCIFGIGIIPAMGVTGAAVATVAAQGVSTVLIVYAARKDKALFPQIKFGTGIEWNYLKEMLCISMPAALQSIIFTGISMVIARLIAGWGDTAVAVQKVGSQIESISWMTAEGFAASLGSFVAQNYGAGNKKRVKEGYKKAMMIITIWGIFSTLLLVFLPGPIFKIFIPEIEVLPAGVEYLRILGYSQLFMCVEITTAGAFSGMGKTIPSSIEGIPLTAMRIPLAAVLSTTALGLSGIWWSISISSMLKGCVLFIWFLIVMHKMDEKTSIE
ncbi:MAG: MATE family efflux transporter [Acetivibrio sp.]